MNNILEKYNNIFNSAIFYTYVCVCISTSEQMFFKYILCHQKLW